MPMKRLDREIAKLEKAYHEHYNSTQYYWVQFFSEHMADVARVFEGDLQLALILSVVGQAALEPVRERAAGNVDASQIGGINASRLADVTGIPRQTVRRKLAEMARNGWLLQRADGSWTIHIGENGPKVRHDLGGLNQRGIARIARLTAQLYQLANPVED